MRVRMAYKHGDQRGAGPWFPERSLANLLRSAAFGNAHCGEGTHWIEREGGACHEPHKMLRAEPVPRSAEYHRVASHQNTSTPLTDEKAPDAGGQIAAIRASTEGEG